MNFDSYTKESVRGKSYQAEHFDELPDYYSDPYLRRYYLIRFFAEAAMVSLGVWGIKLIA
jgi:hypothetical protein